MISRTDLEHLRRCLELAKTALEKGDEPFGSVLVSAAGEVLFEDHNHVAGGDHTQHPEFAIARWSANNLSLEERNEATVYTSGEHCPIEKSCPCVENNSKYTTNLHEEFAKTRNGADSFCMIMGVGK